MGSPSAPVLANLFMGHHEKEWLINYDENFIFQTLYQAILKLFSKNINHTSFCFCFSSSFFCALFSSKYFWHFDQEDLHCLIISFCTSIPLLPPLWIRKSLTVLTDSNVSSSILLLCFPKSSC